MNKLPLPLRRLFALRPRLLVSLTRIPLWTPVSITWEDAHSDYDGHDAEKYVENYKPMVRTSTGFLIGRTDQHVFIAMDDDRAGYPHATDKNCQTVTTIPIRMIEGVKRAA